MKPELNIIAAFRQHARKVRSSVAEGRDCLRWIFNKDSIAGDTAVKKIRTAWQNNLTPRRLAIILATGVLAGTFVGGFAAFKINYWHLHFNNLESSLRKIDSMRGSRDDTSGIASSVGSLKDIDSINPKGLAVQAYRDADLSGGAVKGAASMSAIMLLSVLLRAVRREHENAGLKNQKPNHPSP